MEPLATAFVRIRPTTDEVIGVARAGVQLASDVQAALERFIDALTLPELPEGDRE